ncbi:MAG: glycosyltransferase [Candidatus Saccharibacteria bacterium]|nr:glycosyltransferase [Candidatus Saccharibacteria bacterium]
MIKVLQVSTYNEECGIGKFNERVIEKLKAKRNIHTEYYSKSLNIIKNLPNPERANVVKDIVEISREFDLVHLQHEFGLYSSAGKGFNEIIRGLDRIKKPKVVTIHTAPGLLLREKNSTKKLSLPLIKSRIMTTLHNKKVFYTKLKAFQNVEKIVTFNEFTLNQLTGIVKVQRDKILKTLLPVDRDTYGPNMKYRRMLNMKENDKLLVVTGFINPYKGFVDAVEAMSKLPPEYKLVILGGINPDSGRPKDLIELKTIIEKYKLGRRVTISGFIKNDKLLSTYLKACDIALFPYNPEYYKMASSDAINKAIMNSITTIAYPVESFKEINSSVEGTITITDEPNVNSLVSSIMSVKINQNSKSQNLYRELHSYDNFANEMVKIYEEVTV